MYSSTQATIEIDSIFDGVHPSFSSSKARFEELGEKCLRGSGIDKRNVHDVVLVGGCTRVSIVQGAQVHPTGLVKLDDPDAKIKFLAAESLHGVGSLAFDAHTETVLQMNWVGQTT